MRRPSLLFTAIAAIMLSVPAMSQTLFTNELKAGDPAPQLMVAEWIKGDPITSFEKGKIYSLNFTGTWCVPCMKFLPTLTQIAAKYDGKVNFSTIFVNENYSTRHNFGDRRYIAKVKERIRQLGGGHWVFNMAIDDPKASAAKVWWRVNDTEAPRPDEYASRQPSTNVVVSDGKIVWIGSTEIIDEMLEGIIAGHDPKVVETRIRKKHELIEQRLNEIFVSKENKQYERAIAGMDSLIAACIDVRPDLYFKKFELLAGVDDDSAYQWISYVVDKDVSRLFWSGFVGSLYTLPKKKNYVVAMKAVDYAISKELDHHKLTDFFYNKAGIYVMQQDYRQAIKWIDSAVAISRAEAPESGRNYALEHCKEMQVLIHYMDAWSRHAAGAERILIRSIPGNDVREKWSSLVEKSMMISQDFQVASFGAAVADQALNDPRTKPWREELLMQKSSSHWIEKNKDKAIECCRQAMQIYERKGNKEKAKECKDRIDSYSAAKI